VYVPDHVVVKRIKAYDPHLYVKYNDEKRYFEVWREMAHGHRLITPVVPEIYGLKAKNRFLQLDSRILWWLYESDSWNQDKHHLLKRDRRFQAFQKRKQEQRHSDFKDAAKDMYSIGGVFFPTKHKKKNDPMKAFNKVQRNRWLKPDTRSLTSHRLLSRSKGNAIKYDYEKAG